MKLIPLNDRVIIKPEIREGDLKRGKIIIPNGARELPAIGRVLEVGPGRILFSGAVLPLTVKKGDRVIYSRYGGIELKLTEDDDSMVLNMAEDDILAIIGEDK